MPHADHWYNAVAIALPRPPSRYQGRGGEGREGKGREGKGGKGRGGEEGQGKGRGREEGEGKGKGKGKGEGKAGHSNPPPKRLATGLCIVRR